MPNYLYIRGLRQVDHTVFGVHEGQKYYRSPLTGRPQPYSSGQQVKRSIIDTLVSILDEPRAPITFNWEVSEKNDQLTINQKEPWNPCDPSYADQLVGGWMRAIKGVGTLKRRSPLSISAMRPLHPSLANLEEKESGTFDRSDQPTQHILKVRDTEGNELSSEQVASLLEKTERNLPLRNWLELGSRANGLFVYDIAIDLDRLFTVSTNEYDPELLPETVEKLVQRGWEHNEEASLIQAPQERRRVIVDALARATVDWRISSNQSRTFSPQGTLAVAISFNANSIVNSIRADLREEQFDYRYQADPILDNSISGVDLFISPAAKGFIPGLIVESNALENAINTVKDHLIDATIEK